MTSKGESMPYIIKKLSFWGDVRSKGLITISHFLEIRSSINKFELYFKL